MDAIFESCSGFTTTGSSILPDIEVIPKSILFWRSFTHWLGGMGILVFLLGRPLIGIYNSDAAVIACGLQLLSITAAPYFLCGYMDCLPCALRGMDYSSVPMVFSILGVVGVRLVWIFAIFPHMDHTLMSLYASYPVSWIITSLMQLSCLIPVSRKVYRRLSQAALSAE